jgi:hypothetical protein
MEMRPGVKIIFLVLAACMAFSVVFSEAFIGGGHDHDCTGSECLICLQINAARNLLKILKISCAALFLGAFSIFSVIILLKSSRLNIYQFSPIILKVRNNS